MDAFASNMLVVIGSPAHEGYIGAMDATEARIPLTALDAMLSAALRPAARRSDGHADVPADLRWRLKQLQRQDWPASMAEDRHLKRGYTMRQALRILGAMSLLDAGLGPTQAVIVARDNENSVLSAMMAGAVADVDAGSPRFGVIRPAVIGNAASPSPSILVPRSENSLLKEIRDAAEGRPLLAINLGGLASRALAACREAGCGAAMAALDGIFAEAAREVRAGRGYRPVEAPAGDRYASRGRTRAD